MSIYYPHGVNILYDPDPLKMNQQGVSSLGSSIFPDIGNPFYSQYVVPIKHRSSLDYDDDYHRYLINFFQKKTIKWLYNNELDVFKYFFVENGKTRFVKKPSDMKIKDNDESIKIKKKYIERVFITKYFIKKVLQRYVKKSLIGWENLKENVIFIKPFLHKRLRNLIKQIIKERIKSNK